MKTTVFILLFLLVVSETVAQETNVVSDSSYNSLSILNDYKIRRSFFNLGGPAIHHKYRYTSFGGGFTAAHWHHRRHWINLHAVPSFQLFVARKYGSRISIELNAQYMRGATIHRRFRSRTRELVLTPFLYFDLIQHRGWYQRRPYLVPFLKVGMAGFFNLRTFHMHGHPSFPSFQPMLPAGFGFRYRATKKMDLKFSIVRYFNISGEYSGQHRALGSFNQMELSLTYILRRHRMGVKFR